MTAHSAQHQPNRDAKGKFAAGSTGETHIEGFGGKTTAMMSDQELANMHFDDDPNREVATWDENADPSEAPF